MIDAVLLFIALYHFLAQIRGEHAFTPLMAGAVVLGFIYMVISLSAQKATPKTMGIKIMIVILIIGYTTISSAIERMYERTQTQPYLYIHDHPLQVEEGLGYLTQGKNPYTHDYTNTHVAQWKWGGNKSENPALYHFVSLPSLLYISLPFYIAGQHLVGWYDQRIVHLIFLIIALVSAYTLVRKPQHKIYALMAVGLNPLFTSFFIEGLDDIVIVGMILAALALLKKNKFQLSLIMFAVAVTTKHTAWLLAPFYMLYIWQRGYFKESKVDKIMPWILIVTAALVPWLVWDAKSFFEDTYLYWAGNLATSYPIKGFTLGRLLVDLEVIPSYESYFPFGIVQIALTPLLGWLLIRLYRHPSLGGVLISFGLFLWSFWFLSRVFNESFIGVLSVLFPLGALLMMEEKSEKPSEMPQDVQGQEQNDALLHHP